MTAITLQKQPDITDWNRIISKLPDAHILQSAQWAEIKAQVGWTPIAYQWRDGKGVSRAACMILKRETHLPAGIKVNILYAPKGPILNWEDHELVKAVIQDLKTIARQEKAIFLKIDPDVVLGKGMLDVGNQVEKSTGLFVQDCLNRERWRYSSSQIQFRNSIYIDLGEKEETLLSQMKQKTRYNIRLAEKKGVVVKQGIPDDSEILYKMYAETAVRNGFTIRSKEYYEYVWKQLFEANMLKYLIAYYDRSPIAGLILFHFQKRAYYFYGMSSEVHRELMPTYLLQWEAIKLSKTLGCQIYDLWGAPEQFNDKDPLWGVYRFKEGLGGEVIRTLGAWDTVTNPILYALYTKAMPFILSLMRSRGRNRTIQEAGL